MSHILHRHTLEHYPTAVAGDGVYLIDTNGKRYLDGCGGAAVSCLGHSNTAVKEAIKAQIDQLPYAHTGFFTSESSEALADYLTDRAPDNIDRVYFLTGGSEANETAIKLARQYFVEKGEHSRRLFIAREQSFHGNTMMTLAVGGNQWRKRAFAPCMPETHHIEAAYAYRNQHEDESLEDYGLRAANLLEAKILELGAENVIGFFAEPVVGATAGALTAPPGYFKRIREICNHHGILLIFDEIMCGTGRTGTRFALEQEGVKPDLITIAKGLAGGYQPIGATLISKEIYEAIAHGSGFFQHGHTYIGHPSVTAAALAVQQYIDEHSLLESVQKQGKKLYEALHAHFGEHPHIGDIRGRGLFLGLELVENRETKAPFDANLVLHSWLKQAAMDAGLMIYPMPGTIDGIDGHHILLAPPYILEDAHIDELIDKLGTAISTALGKIPATYRHG